MLETGEISRFDEVGDYASYCRCISGAKYSNGKKKGYTNSKNLYDYQVLPLVLSQKDRLTTIFRSLKSSRGYTMISFKQRHFKKEMILMLVRWYVAYSLSYRDIEELASERGLKVDHSTINRWVIH